MFPKLFASKPEIFGGDVSLVVKHAFLPGVGLTGVVDVHAAVVSGELVHQFAENGKVADDTGVIFKQDFSVFKNGFSENENTVDVGADGRVDIHRVLEGENVPHFPVTSSFVQALLQFRIEYLCTVGAIVAKDDGPRIVHFLLCNFLAFDKLFQLFFVVAVKHKGFRKYLRDYDLKKEK